MRLFRLAGGNRPLFIILFPFIFGGWYPPHWYSSIMHLVVSSHAFLHQCSAEYSRGPFVDVWCSNYAALLSSVISPANSSYLVPRNQLYLLSGSPLDSCVWFPLPHMGTWKLSKQKAFIELTLYLNHFPSFGNHWAFFCCFVLVVAVFVAWYPVS